MRFAWKLVIVMAGSGLIFTLIGFIGGYRTGIEIDGVMVYGVDGGLHVASLFGTLALCGALTIVGIVATLDWLMK